MSPILIDVNTEMTIPEQLDERSEIESLKISQADKPNKVLKTEPRKEEMKRQALFWDKIFNQNVKGRSSMMK